MPMEIATVPCRTDNYAYLLHDPSTGATAVVDVPDAAPVRDALAEKGWKLTDILITHHHSDHVDGVEELKEETGARVVGAAADAHRLPPLDLAVAEGDRVSVGEAEAQVLDVSGHTVGHIAFVFPGAAFTADSLMALGCGRLFEGNPEMMWGSLMKLAALPPDTLIYSGHEYTADNGEFAKTVDSGNPALMARIAEVAKARSAGRPTVPSLLSQEISTNPFLRARASEVKAEIGMPDATDVEAFAEIRRRKDSF
ncbi:hydroxyacylglutathione hydrolase [Tropicimonas marinistellae]|uniref:hydroxyacylglutathione hydrolase n=1 Tax=Tropicimonas marinistellae TaxID=1739787 RepID=UPI00083191A3|nr:hydroxyacylglutathione hydrolase [Tropicimonas marinistellae]